MDIDDKPKRYNRAFARSRDYKRLVAFYLHRYHLRHLNQAERRPNLGKPLEDIYRVAVGAQLTIGEWNNEKRMLTRLRKIIESKTSEIPVDELDFPVDFDNDGFMKALALSKFCEVPQ